ncbi:MAG: ATP-dependent DNA helicase RecG, partial [Spirochaetia bacterium]|nr:ATP-dependent DNA helicase RecG [Spirochaetia bacterium]
VTGAYIKIAYFENEADILYQDEIHGPLILQVEKAIELIYSKYMKALISYDDIYRKETFFFPRAAFRELLLNAVIHKDYLATTPIQIRVYKDKIRLWNDGALPKEVPLENLYKEHVSKPCNPNLANVFFKCGMVESWGRGFEKIVGYCKEENAKIPEIDLSLGGVTARCFASEPYLKLMAEHKEEFAGQNTGVNEGLNEGLKLSDKEQLIFNLIKSSDGITSREIIEKTAFSHATVERATKKLSEEVKIITRDGSKKTGCWRAL